jgi:predicted RNA polymerase sigma factor
MRCRRHIAALHARAAQPEDTDWRQIAGLYEVLLRIGPSPVIESTTPPQCRWSTGRRGRST